MNVDQHIFADFTGGICTSVKEHPKPVDDDRFFSAEGFDRSCTALVHDTLEIRETREVHQKLSGSSFVPLSNTFILPCIMLVVPCPYLSTYRN